MIALIGILRGDKISGLNNPIAFREKMKYIEK